MAFLSRGVLAVLCLPWTAALGQAADRAIIVLDASGSMWGQVDGRPKVDIARETLRTVLQSVPSDTELGLMAYGHRDKGSCADVELVVPPAEGTASAIAEAADGMSFLGKTPLTSAVRQAAEALRYTEEKSTVILITDGVESCEADPCALGRELESAGVDFTAHVVGFGLTADEGMEVACLAENTGGKYLLASNAAALEDALSATVATPPEATPQEQAPEPEPAPPVVAEPAPTPAPEPAPAPAPEPAKPKFNFIPEAVMAAGGEPLKDGNVWEIFKANADGSRGEQIATEYSSYKGSLEPGDYIVRARLGEASVEQALKVEPGQVYTPLFALDAGTLIVRPRASEGGAVSAAATVTVEYPGGEVPSTNYGEAENHTAGRPAEAEREARHRRGQRDVSTCRRPDRREGRRRRRRPCHRQCALRGRRREGRCLRPRYQDIQGQAERRRHARPGELRLRSGREIRSRAGRPHRRRAHGSGRGRAAVQHPRRRDQGRRRRSSRPAFLLSPRRRRRTSTFSRQKRMSRAGARRSPTASATLSRRPCRRATTSSLPIAGTAAR